MICYCMLLFRALPPPGRARPERRAYIFLFSCVGPALVLGSRSVRSTPISITARPTAAARDHPVFTWAGGGEPISLPPRNAAEENDPRRAAGRCDSGSRLLVARREIGRQTMREIGREPDEVAPTVLAVGLACHEAGIAKPLQQAKRAGHRQARRDADRAR